MAGYVSFYNQLPRLRTYPASMTFDGADISAGFVKLHNVRGQVLYTIRGEDAGGGDVTVASFGVTGGFGDYPQYSTKNFYYNPNTAINCSITEISVNRFRVSVIAQGGQPATDYVFQFFYDSEQPPQVHALTDLTGRNITVTLTKQNIVEGY